jgi:GNAT superfamily N-acetyltransferase
VTEDELIRRTCETIAGYLALGNERFSAAGATFVLNLSTPLYPESNHVGLIRVSGRSAIDALTEASNGEFADLPYRHYLLDPLTPPDVSAYLAFQPGYRSKDTLHVILEGDIPTKRREAEIREVLTDADWASYHAMDKIWWLEYGGGVRRLQRWGRLRLARLKTLVGSQAEAVHDQVVRSKRLKAPHARTWFACVDGVPAAFLTSWPGENGVGRIVDLYTHPDFRRRGLASALVHHCVAVAREGGAGPVTIDSELNTSAKETYGALGFRPIFLTRDVYVEPRTAAAVAGDATQR